MIYRHPIWRDDDHLYTLAREPAGGWCITMIPAERGLLGQGHIICPVGMQAKALAERYLARWAVSCGLRRVYVSGGVVRL